MPFYSRGAFGPEVERIQERLKNLGLYRGPVDGQFGGGTESAVRLFQDRERLGVDGVVGSGTWKRLFPDGGAIAAPGLTSTPLGQRILAMTGSFETSTGAPDCFGCVSGDFDGQGISFGALQWNLGRGTLQPLLKTMLQRHPDVTRAVFHDHTPVLAAMLGSPQDEQLAWARSLQTPRKALVEPWAGLFRTLGRCPEFQTIELESAAGYLATGETLCRTFELRSERALALMFDIAVQNGGIPRAVGAQILNDLTRIPAGPDGEEARLVAVARRRAAAADPRWVADVLTRKLTVATGKGSVHGRNYNLAEQFGITLTDRAPAGRSLGRGVLPAASSRKKASATRTSRLRRRR